MVRAGGVPFFVGQEVCGHGAKAVNAAQQAWCDALVKIGELQATGVDHRGYAEHALSGTYQDDQGKVFFMPALAFGEQTFRNDNADADNQGIQIHGSVTITMGHVWAIDKDGNAVMVDRTWLFRKAGQTHLECRDPS